MQCKSCGIFMDAEVYTDESQADCIFCGGGMRYTATDYLSLKELGLVSEVRPTQLALADQLQQAITQQQHVVVEAGTGVGKSFAYLLATILNGRRVVISTAKKSLMSQLIEKDLPRLQDLIGPELTFAPAYGKSNYGCRKAAMHAPKAEDKAVYSIFFDRAPTWHWNEANDAFDDFKRDNPKHKLPVLPQDHWRYTANECVGRECDFFRRNECEYMKARAKVAHSKVVVTNHWLLGFDIALRSGALGVSDGPPVELLGEYHVLAIDEAHKFEEGFRTAYTSKVEENFLSKAVDKYCGRLEECGVESPTFPREHELTKAWGALFRKLAAVPGRDDEATELSASYLGSEGQTLLHEAQAAFQECQGSKVLKSLFGSRAKAVQDYLTKPEVALPTTMLEGTELDKLFAHRRMMSSLGEVILLLENAYSGDDNFVTYLEKGDFQRKSSINVSPIRMGGYLQRTYEQLDSTIFISATLAVSGDFDDFERRVGLDRDEWNGKVSRGVYGSAFDFKKQALLYLSKNVPIATYQKDTRDAYRDALAEEVKDLVTASEGCAFVLFTSRVEMDHVYDYLLRSGCRLPLMRQTPGLPASEVLKRYRESTNPVLLGLKSFWEGVDVQGDQLQLVVIAKLPFPGRSDPIVSARREREGNDWFSRVDLPDMVLDLRQGVGRLIRSTTDRGVVAVLDQRLLTKRYKGRVLKSLGFDNITNNKEATLKALRNLAAKR